MGGNRKGKKGKKGRKNGKGGNGGKAASSVPSPAASPAPSPRASGRAALMQELAARAAGRPGAQPPPPVIPPPPAAAAAVSAAGPSVPGNLRASHAAIAGAVANNAERQRAYAEAMKSRAEPSRERPPPTGAGIADRIDSLHKGREPAEQAAGVATELANLRRRGLAKIFNKHFTKEAESIAVEREAAEQALILVERRKEELSKARGHKPDRGDGGGSALEMSKIDALRAEMQRRRNDVRQKEQETKELYRRYVCQFPDATAQVALTDAHKHRDREDAGAGKGSPGRNASAANIAAAADFFRMQNTAANAGLPVRGGNDDDVPSEDADSFFGDPRNRAKYSGREVRSGYGVDTVSANAANNAAADFFRSVNTSANAGLPLIAPGLITSHSASRDFSGLTGKSSGYTGGHGGLVVSPTSPDRRRSSAKRILPSVEEEGEPMADDKDVLWQADLLMAKMKEKHGKDLGLGTEVGSKRTKIDDTVTQILREGKDIVIPVGSDNANAIHHGSRHSVMATGTDGENLVVLRSGGVLNRDSSGDADVKDADVNWKSYRERFPSSSLNVSKVAESFVAEPIQLPVLTSPVGKTWTRPRPVTPPRHVQAKALAEARANESKRPSGANAKTTSSQTVTPSQVPLLKTKAARNTEMDLHLDDEDDVSSLGSLGGLTTDDMTVATNTLMNFLSTETRNIKAMFAEAERLENEGIDEDSRESDDLSRAARAAESMAEKMAEATKWIDNDGSGLGSDADENAGTAAISGRLYSIVQTGEVVGLKDENIHSVAWNAYWSTEQGREYYHEPLTNTTTWTKPPGETVESMSSKETSARNFSDTTFTSDHPGEDTVEVKDFTLLAPFSTNGSCPKSQSSDVSDLASLELIQPYENLQTPQQASSRSRWFKTPSTVMTDVSDATHAALSSADDFRPDSMFGISSSSASLAGYRAKQKRRRQKKRARAAALVLMISFMVLVALKLKGDIIVPGLDGFTGGRLMPLFKLLGVADLTLQHHEQDISKETPPPREADTPEMKTAPLEELRTRSQICNIPFAYIFLRRCWAESSELPLPVEKFINSMML